MHLTHTQQTRNTQPHGHGTNTEQTQDAHDTKCDEIHTSRFDNFSSGKSTHSHTNNNQHRWSETQRCDTRGGGCQVRQR